MARSTTPLRAIGATFALLLMSACSFASQPPSRPAGETRFVIVDDAHSSAGNLQEDDATQNDMTWRIDAPGAQSCQWHTVGVDDLFDGMRTELPVPSP